MAKKPVGGVAGIWLDDHELVKAAAKVRDAGFKNWDSITPFPVHGLEDAMGIKRSVIPFITFGMGLTGFLFGLWLTVWTSAFNWPINVGGKPFVSGPAFVPVMFECTILFAALSSVASVFIFSRLPKIDPPIIDRDLTSHKFAIFIAENDPAFNRAKTEELLKSLGADEVRYIAEY